MTAYIFTGLKAELKDFKILLNKILLDHAILETRYAASVKDLQVINDRLAKIDKDLLLTRERNHDIANAIQTLWNYALKNGWSMLPKGPQYRNEVKNEG
jgi:hypothetical protein